MAEAARDHIDSKRTVDDIDELFQYLVHTRRTAPLIARDQIRERLRLKELWLDFHVRGGTRPTTPLPEAPEEERKAARKAITEGRPWSGSDLYPPLPPEGKTGRVHHDCWESERIFQLVIEGEHLVIKPGGCALDYPWDAYSFTIANWSRIDELWPRSSQAAVPTASVTPEASAPVVTSPATAATPSTAATVSKAASDPKMHRAAWLRMYIADEEAMEELVANHDTIGKGAAEINRRLAQHPELGGAYKTSRIIEDFLRAAKVYPKIKMPRR